MHPGDDDQPRWPEGTPVRPDGHGPGGGRFRGTGDVGGADVGDLVSGLQGASSRPWYETAAGQIAQQRGGGHPRVAYNLAVINAAQAQYNENRGDGFHDEQLPQLIGQYNVAEAQGNPAGQDVAVDQLRLWIDSHYPEQWAGALPARVEAREAPRAADQDQRNSAALDLARTAQANIEVNTGDPDDALAIRIEALERHLGRTGHRVEADREAAALRRYMDHEMDQEAASPPGTAVMHARLEASRPSGEGQELRASEIALQYMSGRPLELNLLDGRGWGRITDYSEESGGTEHRFELQYEDGGGDEIFMGSTDRLIARRVPGSLPDQAQQPEMDHDRNLRLVNAMETPEGGEVTAAELLELVGNGHRLEVLGRHGWDRVETVDVSGEGDHFIYLENDPEPISMSPEGRVAIRFPQTPEPATASTGLSLGGNPLTDRDAWNRLVVHLARQHNDNRARDGLGRDEVMDQMVADIEHPDVTDVQGVADSNAEVLRQRLERMYRASIIDPPTRRAEPQFTIPETGVISAAEDVNRVRRVTGQAEDAHLADMLRVVRGELPGDPHGMVAAMRQRLQQIHGVTVPGGDDLEALNDRDLRDLGIEYDIAVPAPPLAPDYRADLIARIRYRQQADANRGVSRAAAHSNVNWADTHISHQRPRFYRQAVDDYQMPLQIRDAQGQWRTVTSIGYPTNGQYEITHDGPTGHTFVPENHTITARFGSDRSGTTNQDRQRFNQQVAVVAESMLEQVAPEDRADDEGYTRLRAALDSYNDTTSNPNDQESIDSAVDDLVNELADWDIYFDVPPYQDYDSGGPSYLPPSRYNGGVYTGDDEEDDYYDQPAIPEIYGNTLAAAISQWPQDNDGDLPSGYEDRAAEIWDWHDPVTGYRAEVTSVGVDGDGLSVEGRVYDGDTEIGKFTRTINSSRPQRIYHAYFKMYDNQGGGFATRWLDQVKQQYRDQGFTEIGVSADIDVGGYAWAKMGFDFATRDSARFTLMGMTSQIVGAHQAGRIDDRTLHEAQELQRRFDAGEHITPLEIAMVGWRSRAEFVDLEPAPLDPNGDPIEMWWGKRFLLGRSWSGVMQL
jgi:hypothetical protein